MDAEAVTAMIGSSACRGIAILLAVLALAEPAGIFEARAASFTSPTATATGPKLDLQGNGSLVPGGNCICAAEPSAVINGCICPGVFTSSLTGPPYGKVSLKLSLEIALTPTGLGENCYQSSGSGQLSPIKDTDVNFKGELCVSTYTYSLDGTLQIFPFNPCTVPQQVAVGTLEVFGAVHQSGPVPTPSSINPIPQGTHSSAQVSIVGTACEIAAPCPSP